MMQRCWPNFGCQRGAHEAHLPTGDASERMEVDDESICKLRRAADSNRRA